MTTFEPLEAQDVVLAEEADACVRDLLGEVGELTERMREVTAQVEVAEAGTSTSGDAELSDSQQLTLQFVEDLVATNRERMREVISQRYVWVGDRLAEAQAEAQAITHAATSELATALAEHDGGLVGHLDDRSVAELVASIPSAGPARVGPAVEPIAEGPRSAEIQDDPPLLDRAPADARDTDGEGTLEGELAAPVDPAEVDDPLVAVDHVTVPISSSPFPAEGDTGAVIDDAVSAAVQAVLRALADPATEADASAPPSNGTPTGAAPEHLAWILPGPDLGEVEDSDHSRNDPSHHDFWGDKAPGPTPPSSRFVPRDLVVSMLVLVMVVIVALLLAG